MNEENSEKETNNYTKLIGKALTESAPWKAIELLIKEYPYDKNKIMESLICSSDEDFKKCIDLSYYCSYRYGKNSVNIVGERPIDCFVTIYQNCSDEQRDRLIEKLLANTNLFAFVIANAKILEKIFDSDISLLSFFKKDLQMENIAKYKETIIKKYIEYIFSSEAIEEKIDDLLLATIPNKTLFKEIINCCSYEQKNKIFEKLLSTPMVFCRVINNSEDIEKLSNDFPEYALILKLNFELRKAIENNCAGEGSEAIECLSNIHNAIKFAFANGAIKYETLRHFSNFLSVFAILPDYVVPDEFAKKLGELYAFSSNAKIPSLAELCVNSLIKGKLYSANPCLEVLSLQNYGDFEKLFDVKKDEITSKNNIVLVKLLETNEFCIIGVNKEGKCAYGVIDNDSDLGKTLLEDEDIPIEGMDQQKKIAIFEKAKDYLGTNLELVNARAAMAFKGIVRDEKIEFKK